MAKEKRELPPLRAVILRDYRSRWDGVVQKVLAGPHLERSVSRGEIAVFEPTGKEFPIEEGYMTKGGSRSRTVVALEYARVSTRLV